MLDFLSIYILHTLALILIAMAFWCIIERRPETRLSHWGSLGLLAAATVFMLMISYNGWSWSPDPLGVAGLTFSISGCVLALMLGRKHVIWLMKDADKRANKDKLTGLLNRQGLEEIIYALIKDTEGRQYTLATLMFSIDHFQDINEEYGYAFGNDMLKALSSILLAYDRQGGRSVRVGGDTFVLALPVANLDVARAYAELVRQRWERYSLFDEENGVQVTSTVSVGVSLNRSGEQFSEMMLRAEKTLHGAKLSGRNQVKTQTDLQIAELRMAAQNMAQFAKRPDDQAKDFKQTP